jgi:hypothetical protein
MNGGAAFNALLQIVQSITVHQQQQQQMFAAMQYQHQQLQLQQAMNAQGGASVPPSVSSVASRPSPLPREPSAAVPQASAAVSIGGSYAMTHGGYGANVRDDSTAPTTRPNSLANPTVPPLIIPRRGSSAQARGGRDTHLLPVAAAAGRRSSSVQSAFIAPSLASMSATPFGGIKPKRTPLPRSNVIGSYALAAAKGHGPRVVYLGALDRPTCTSLAHAGRRYQTEHQLAPEDAHCPECYMVNSRGVSEAADVSLAVT